MSLVHVLVSKGWGVYVSRNVSATAGWNFQLRMAHRLNLKLIIYAIIDFAVFYRASSLNSYRMVQCLQWHSPFRTSNAVSRVSKHRTWGGDVSEWFKHHVVSSALYRGCLSWVTHIAIIRWALCNRWMWAIIKYYGVAMEGGVYLYYSRLAVWTESFVSFLYRLREIGMCGRKWVWVCRWEMLNVLVKLLIVFKCPLESSGRP